MDIIISLLNNVLVYKIFTEKRMSCLTRISKISNYNVLIVVRLLCLVQKTKSFTNKEVFHNVVSPVGTVCLWALLGQLSNDVYPDIPMLASCEYNGLFDVSCR